MKQSTLIELANFNCLIGKNSIEHSGTEIVHYSMKSVVEAEGREEG